MRGDFLGQASIKCDDLEVGRELDLPLVQREGAHGESVRGTIRVLVGEPVVETPEEEQRLAKASLAVGTTAASGAESFRFSRFATAGHLDTNFKASGVSAVSEKLSSLPLEATAADTATVASYEQPSRPLPAGEMEVC